MSYTQDLVNGYAAAHKRLMGETPKTRKYNPAVDPPPPPPVKIPPLRTYQPPAKFDLSTLNSLSKRLSLSALLKWVSHHERITITELQGGYRNKRIVEVRQIFAYLARQYGSREWPVIARYLNRDRTTVYYAWIKLGKERKTNPFMEEALRYYEEILESFGFSPSMMDCMDNYKNNLGLLPSKF